MTAASHVGCGGKEPEATAQTAAAPSGGGAAANGKGGPGGDAPATPPTAVAAVRASLDTIRTHYASTATLEAEKMAQILARVDGPILKIVCEEGDEVREGQTLLLIEPAPRRLRQERTESTLKTEQLAYDRLKGMHEREMVSAGELEAGESRYRLALADRDLAALELSYTEVKAPFSGTITRRLVDPGRNVSPGTPLFEIADFHPLLAKVHVPAKEFGKLATGQTVSLVLDSSQQALTGRVTLVSPMIDPATGTIKVTAEVETYPAGTRPGDFAEVRVVTETHAGVLAVPNLAVFQDRGENILYSMDGDVAHRRVVTLGVQDEAKTQILSGLAAGEMVIVKGQRSLREGAPVKLIGEEGTSSAADEAGEVAEQDEPAGDAKDAGT